MNRIIRAMAPLTIAASLLAPVVASAEEITFVLPLEISNMPEEIAQISVTCAARSAEGDLARVTSNVPLDANGAYTGELRIAGGDSRELARRAGLAPDVAVTGGWCEVGFLTANGQICHPSDVGDMPSAQVPCRQGPNAQYQATWVEAQVNR